MDKLKQTIVSLAVENCELRQELESAKALQQHYFDWWQEEKNKNMAKEVEREG
jgi:hypothetical protein